MRNCSAGHERRSGKRCAEWKHTGRELRLPFAVKLGDWVLCVICHGGTGTKEGAQEGDAGHRAQDSCALGSVVKGAAECSRVCAEEGAGCVCDGVEGADKVRKGGKAHVEWLESG